MGRPTYKRPTQQEYEQQVKDILSRATGGIPWSTTAIPISAVKLAQAVTKLNETSS